MTRAELLAEYLGLTPETHPACYEACKRYECMYHPEHRILVHEHKMLAVADGFCSVCDCPIVLRGWATRLSLPDPLAPGTAADAWLGPLVRTKEFWTIHGFTDGFGANVFREGWKSPFDGKATDPTPAIVRAMMAADPTFREKMEGAEG